MNIGGVSTSMATANVNSQVGTAMLKKTMDTNEALGEGVVKMMDDAAALERSVNPEIGANFDMRV